MKMGTVYDEITLKNAVDVGMEKRGLIKEPEVRQTTIQVVADTGADTLVINESIREALGLRITGTRVTYLANGNGDDNTCLTEPVEVHWKNRSMVCRPWLMPDAPEVLLGAIPLEDMDITVDCNRQCLVGVHGDQQIGHAY
jgi:predicted aspartyl protease